MAVTQFDIKLYKPRALYNPGEKVAGEVILKLTGAQSCRGIKLNITGKTEVSWPQAGGRQYHIGEEEYFNVLSYILGNPRETTELTPGHHIFPFTFTLPKNIPSSFEHEHGHIRYRIKVYIDKPWERDPATKISFAVHNPLDLTQFTSRPIIGEINEAYYYCLLPCLTEGFMYAKVRISSNSFNVGDRIEVLVAMDNSGSVDVTNIHMALKQKLTFCTDVNARSRKFKTEVIRMVSYNGPFWNIRTTKLEMEIPYVPDSGLRYCNMIDVNYRITVTIVTGGCHMNESRDYEILIGSKPVATTAGNSRRSSTTSTASPAPSIRTRDTPLTPISELPDSMAVSPPPYPLGSSLHPMPMNQSAEGSPVLMRFRTPSPSAPADRDAPPSYESVVSETNRQ